MVLKLYGENAFTFRFFNSIESDSSALKKLLDNLKRFDDPKSRFQAKGGNRSRRIDADIWLFPSFGKRSGFGEPDALVLVDGQVLWFEVETSFGLDGPDDSKAIDSLRQIYRFHRAALAFGKSPKRDRGRLLIKGLTITNENEPKYAQLALRGHKAVAQLRDRLKAAQELNKSHFVLLSIDQPRGGASGFHKALITSAQANFQYWDSKLGSTAKTEPLRLDHCWYTYWSGDLNRFFRKEDFLAGYVPIKKGS